MLRFGLDDHSHDGSGDVVLCNGLQYCRQRVGFVAHILADGQEPPGFHLVELPLGVSPLHFGDDKALDFLLFAKVDPLQTATIHDGRVLAPVQFLVAVDMAQCHVIPHRDGQYALKHHHIAPQHHGALRAELGV